MSQQDRMYFANRAAEEQKLAEDAVDDHAAAAHRKMPRAYVEKASIGERPHDDSQTVG